jgi:phage-related protein
MKLNIYFYQSANGKEIVLDYINSLKEREQFAIKAFLYRFQKENSFRMMPYCRKIKGEIFEMRVRTSDSYGILYAYVFGDAVVLLHIFKKKTKKTPLNDIKLAINRLKGYE